ncbi:MAG: pyridoxal phosphate-dependent decarboxylase family protein [Bellilinea sp.]
MESVEKDLVMEETLDPQDWHAMRHLGHRMVDDMMDYLQGIREHPVWRPVPQADKDRLNQPLPLESQPIEEVYAEFLRHILPNPMGNIHPRFWGWVIGTGSPTGMLAEMLAAGMNPNVGGGDHVANYVEKQVIEWLREIIGLPPGASGLLVTGGSMANLVGLTVARSAKAGFDVRKEGLQCGSSCMTVYASVETHSCVKKGVELLGMGSQAMRSIPVNDRYQIDLSALEAAVKADRADGKQPIMVVGNAGTVNTGAIDDLQALADFCQRENLWFHVDAAIGGVAASSENLRPLFSGMERADSVAIDLHKWMYMPYEIGCALVRDPQLHRNAFAETPEYLAHADRGLAGGDLWFSDLGVQLSRGFRSLKAWMMLKEQGVHKYGRMMDQNVAQIHYLKERVDREPELELVAPMSLNILCFRFNPGGLDLETLNAINRELLIRLHESGVAVPSYTTLNGVYALRVANTNHRSRREDFDIFVDATLRLGREIHEEMVIV